MVFSDSGIVLDGRPYGETAVIVTVFTRSHGVRSGMVYGGQGRKRASVIQPGNEVDLEWKGRNEDSLGYFSLELRCAYAAGAMADRTALAALSAVCALALACFPECVPCRRSCQSMSILLGYLDNIRVWPALVAKWETGLLSELGFALTLDRCAATGSTHDLRYVSPRSARAVSAEAGEPYRDRLLPLPPFLCARTEQVPAEVSVMDAADALKMTGYFIEKGPLYGTNRAMPEARRKIPDLLLSLAD